MAALRCFKIICGPLPLVLLLLLLQDLGVKAATKVEPYKFECQSPQGRTTAGSRASFRCIVYDVPSEDINIVWMKDGERIQSNQNTGDIQSKGEMAYYVTSSVEILLGQGDIRSQLTCRIQHNSALLKNFSLGDFLRVPPKMSLETKPPSPVPLNASVTVTCNAESFYPEDATMELFAKDAPSRKGMVPPRILNPDGTFSFESYLEVMATQDRNSSMFLCQVQHDSQPLVIETPLFITRPPEKPENLETNNPQKYYFILLCVTLFLSKAAILLLISCLILVKIYGHKRTKLPEGDRK